MLATLAVTTLTVGLDATIISVALPTLAGDLHASNSQLQWFADSYNLTLSAALLPIGLLGDRFGRKRVLMLALAVFAVASAASGYAHTPTELIAARGVLGIAGAAMVPLSIAVLPTIFPEHERAKAMSVWVAASAAGFPIGPILGGWMLGNFWWGSVFLINVPVAFAAIAGLAVLLPESRSARRPRLDFTGMAASGLGLAGLTFGVIELGQNGWGDTAGLAATVGGVVLLVAFVAWQAALGRRPGGEPLVDLGLFRSPGFSWGSILACLVTFAMFGVLFAAPQFFTAVEGADSLGSGLRLLPIIGGLVVGAKAGERLAARIGERVVIALGFGVMTVGFVLGALTGVHASYGYVAVWVALSGVGLGFAMPTSMTLAINALPEDGAGVGSALLQALRQVAGTIAVALLGTVLAAGYRARLDLAGVSAPAAKVVKSGVIGGISVSRRVRVPGLLDSVRGAFVHGMGLMLWVTAVPTVVGVFLALRRLPRGKGAVAAGESLAAGAEVEASRESAR